MKVHKVHVEVPDLRHRAARGEELEQIRLLLGQTSVQTANTCEQTGTWFACAGPEKVTPLAKRERKDRDAGIEEFDLKGHVSDRTLLPNELIHPRLSNFARTIGAGIGSVIATGLGAIQLYPEANGRCVPSRAQDHMEVAAVEAEHYLAGHRLE